MPEQLSLMSAFDEAALDPTARKHGGDPASQDAWQKARQLRGEHHAEILDQLRGRGEIGMTAKEYARLMGVQLNCVSGRFSELADAGRIRKGGLRRDGAAVWLLASGAK